MFSRRKLLFRASAGSGWLALSGVPLFAASDFWNKKDAAEWSDQEKDTLKTKSPWAKKIHGERGFGGGRGGGRGDSMSSGGSKGSFGGMSGAESNGISAGGGGGGRGSRGGGGDMGGSAPAPQGPEVVIRFESAAPILAATKLELPAALADHYAVSITGLPPQLVSMMLSGRGGRGRGRGRDGAQEAPPEAEQPPADPAAEAKARQDRVLHAASLSAKNKDPQAADSVMQTADKQTIIFGFAKASLPIGPADKDLEFILRAGPMEFKAKFEPKEMMYKGALAL